jgi:tetratricopeptide (TPR) repeat protein
MLENPPMIAGLDPDLLITKPDLPVSWFDAAQAHFAAGAFAEAEAAYRAVIAAQPGHIEAHIGAARCARERGAHAESLALFQSLKSLVPAASWACLEAASDLRALGRLAEAELDYAAARVLEPENIYARIGLGHCARARGDHEAALALFQSVLAVRPDAPWASLEVAADLRDLGRFGEAETLYNAVLALEPGNTYAQIGLGLCARARGDRACALAQFQAATGTTEPTPWPWLEAAAEWRELGRLDEADAACRHVLAMGSANALARLGLGHGARARGDRRAALAYFEAASRDAPAELWPWLEIATEQREAGQIDAARQTARDVLAQHPRAFNAMLSIAYTERDAGRHAAALAAFAQAHLANPGQPGILVDMAQQEHRLGHPKKCERYLDQALSLDPLHAGAIACRAGQAMQAGNPALAYDLHQQAAAARPGELVFQLGMLDALAAMGQADAAIAQIATLEAARGFLPQLRVRRINLLRQYGHTHAALALAREATALAPHNPWLWTERFHTEILAGEGISIEFCLREMPATSLQARAARHRFTGNLAESRWHIALALRHYEAAAAINPEDAPLQHDLIRTKTLMQDFTAAREHLRRFCALEAPATRLRGKSLNISKTHYGQILDDYSLDAELAATLAELQPLPPAARAAALAGTVRANPDNTALAVSLLVALRQSGALHATVPDPGSRIPRTIAQFWDATDIPADITAIMASWRQLNPDYAIRRFDDKAARIYLATRFPPLVLQAYRRVRETAQKADIFRLAWLVAEGGIYADADDRCLRPVDTLIPDASSLVLYLEDHGTLGNNFIAAAPQNPVLVSALHIAVTAVNRGDTDIAWLATGPGLISRAFAQALVANPGKPTLPQGAVVLDRRALCQVVGMHCAAAYKTAGQHWTQTTFASRRKPPEPV